MFGEHERQSITSSPGRIGLQGRVIMYLCRCKKKGR